MKKSAIFLWPLLLFYALTVFAAPYAFAATAAENPQGLTGTGVEVLDSLLEAGKVGPKDDRRPYFQVNKSISVVVGEVIKAILAIVGVIFLALVVYGGFEWLTSAGDEKKVGTALGIIQQGAIGLAIVLGAYSITAFVTSALQRAAGLP